MLLIGAGILGVGSLASAATGACRGGLADRAVCHAAKQFGDTYVWGGKGPNVFDCSGLTHYVYKRAGLNWRYRTAEGQYQLGVRKKWAVPADSLRKGDLLFFDWDGGEIDHVGIYAGKGAMIHASSGAGQVKKVKLTAYHRGHMKKYAVRLELARSSSVRQADPTRVRSGEPAPVRSDSPKSAPSHLIEIPGSAIAGTGQGVW